MYSQQLLDSYVSTDVNLLDKVPVNCYLATEVTSTTFIQYFINVTDNLRSSRLVCHIPMEMGLLFLR